MGAGVQSNSDMLADFKDRMGITATPLGLTVGGGWLTWTFTAAAAVTGGSVAVRAGIITTDDSTASEVPALSGQGVHSDWMWYQVAYLTPQNPQTVLFDGQQSPMLRWRAMRRLDEIEMRLWFCVFCEVAGNVEFDSSTVLINP